MLLTPNYSFYEIFPNVEFPQCAKIPNQERGFLVSNLRFYPPTSADTVSNATTNPSPQNNIPMTTDIVGPAV